MWKYGNGTASAFRILNEAKNGVIKAWTQIDEHDNAVSGVVGKNRSLQSLNGVFQDSFANYAVHIYKISHLTGMRTNRI